MARRYLYKFTFVAFVISRDPSACTSVEHVYNVLGKNVSACFVDFYRQCKWTTISQNLRNFHDKILVNTAFQSHEVLLLFKIGKWKLGSFTGSYCSREGCREHASTQKDITRRDGLWDTWSKPLLTVTWGHTGHYLDASPPGTIKNCDAWRFVTPWKDEPVPRKQRRQSSTVPS